MCLSKKVVGNDEFGNIFYEKAGKRFVEYKLDADPAKLTVEWYYWLNGFSGENNILSCDNLSAKFIKPRALFKSGINVGAKKFEDSYYTPWIPK